MSDNFRMAIVIRQPSAGLAEGLSLFEEKWPLKPKKRRQLCHAAYEEPYADQQKIEQEIRRRMKDGHMGKKLESNGLLMLSDESGKAEATVQALALFARVSTRDCKRGRSNLGTVTIKTAITRDGQV